MRTYIYFSFRVLPVHSIKPLPGVGPINDGQSPTVEMIHVTEYGFDQASLASPKDCVDEFTQGEFWEGEGHLGKIVTYFYTFNVDL